MDIVFRHLTHDDSQEIGVIAGLHMDLLGFGPMAQLGYEFIRDIGYKVHLEDELFDIILCEVDGRAAGFVAFTSRSISFHRSSLGRHWFAVSGAVFRSILKDPRRIVGLKRAVWMVASRRNDQLSGRDPLGEVVCLAVRPEYLSRAFIRESGIWISERLISDAMESLRRSGCSRMRMFVDEANKAPLLVYHRMGARFEAYTHGGEPNILVWFDLDTPSSV